MNLCGTGAADLLWPSKIPKHAKIWSALLHMDPLGENIFVS